MKVQLISLFLLLTICSTLKAQQEIKLYPNGPKESNGLAVTESYRDPEFIINISDARMYYYPAPKEKSNGVSVVICPGGGYAGVSQIKEGSEIARWFNDLGVTAFVLYYRMPNGHTTVPLTDAQTALKIVRDRAKEWHINPSRIGIMGFSAGGHLASTAGTHFENKEQRPAFMILGYPVVTMQKPLTHGGSRTNLLGNNPDSTLVLKYSNELQVTKKTPPTFIFHAKDDKAVPVQNSLQLEATLKQNNIPVELHLYETGGHGFGMRNKNNNWPEALKSWLEKQQLLPNN